MSLGSPRWKVVYFLAYFHLANDVRSSVSALPPLFWMNRRVFKFNLTLMGVILHIMTILINLRCCHGNLLL